MSMVNQRSDWVADLYWNELIKKFLSESTQHLFTIEIWERLKDNYGYTYGRERVEKELFNLQRTGYANLVTIRGKQAWMYPTGMKLLTVERNKEIDYAISKIIEAKNSLPTANEIVAKLNKPISQQEVAKRLVKISILTNSIDSIIKKICQQSILHINENKKLFEEEKFSCTTDKRGIDFYETIIDQLNGIIEDIDILTIVTIIDARKKLYSWILEK